MTREVIDAGVAGGIALVAIGYSVHTRKGSASFGAWVRETGFPVWLITGLAVVALLWPRS